MAKEKVTIFYGDEESVEARFNSFVESLKGGRKHLTYTEKTIFFVNDYLVPHGKFSNIREYPDRIYQYRIYPDIIYKHHKKTDNRAIYEGQLNDFNQKCQLFYENFKNILIHRGHGEYITITPDLHLKAVIKVDCKERAADLSAGDYMAYIFLCWLQYVKFLQYIGEKM